MAILASTQNMPQMTMYLWKNDLPYCMHVVCNATVHPTTWDICYNVL